MMGDFLHGELTYRLIGMGMEIHRELGPGFLEKVYENALMVLLHRNGIDARQQVTVTVKFQGAVVGDYCADILVEDKVILELKALDRITDIHKAQALNYLKATGIDLALIMNFGARSFENYRLINRFGADRSLTTAEPTS